MPDESHSESRSDLRGWKAIADFLDVTPRTAQLWEQRQGLPIRRLPGTRGTVFARVAELDRWSNSGGQPEVGAPITSTPIISDRGSPASLFVLLPVCAGLAAAFVLSGASSPVWESIRRKPSATFEFTDQRLIPRALALSPNGRKVAYWSGNARDRRLAILDVKTGETTRLAEGLSPIYPSWSPDGRLIAFWSFGNSQLYVCPSSGGECSLVVRIAGTPSGTTWSPDGRSIVVGILGTGLFEIDLATGQRRLVLDHPHVEEPSFLPVDGERAILFASQVNRAPYTRSLADAHAISLLWPDSGRTREILKVQFSSPWPTYHPSGHILYTTGLVGDLGLTALPFSLDRLEPAGDPVLVQRKTLQASASGSGAIATLDVPRPFLSLFWRDRSGRRQARIGKPMWRLQHPSIAPDGKTALVSGAIDGDYDIWIHSQGGATQVTFDSSYEEFPRWSADQKSIVYTSRRDGAPVRQIFHLALDGSHGPLRLSPETDDDRSFGWSRSNGLLLFSRRTLDKKVRLWRRPVPGDGKAKPFPMPPGSYDHAVWSPDDRWVAYDTSKEKRNVVAVHRFDGTTLGPQQYAVDGSSPRWSKGGSELIFVRRGALHAVAAELGEDNISFGPQERLFPLNSAPEVGGHYYDVTADGSRFLVIEGFIEPNHPVKLHIYPELPVH